MFQYTLKLAFQNLKNRPDLTILTIFLVAIGLALLTTMTTMGYQSSKIPLQDKSESLYTVLLDSRDKNADNLTSFRRLPALTYIDAENIVNAQNTGVEKSYLWKSFAFLNVDSNEANPRQVRVMAGQSNFFSFFETPFLFGRGWTEEDDKTSNQVIVLSYEMNQHFFGGENSIGQLLNVNSTPLTVIGVMAQWKLPSRFYDRSFSSNRFDDIFIPSNLAMNINLPRRVRCWEKDLSLVQRFSLEDIAGLQTSECNWINLWAHIKSADDVQPFKSYIDQYVVEQKSLGRFPRPAQNVLVNINDYIASIFSGVNNDFVFILLSWLFFSVCLVNTIGLLLTKYMGKIPEIALRRALGAKKKTILSQYMIEIAVISFLGGILGLILSYFGLIGMMKISIYQSDYRVTAEAIGHGYQLDWTMIIQALTIAVGSTFVVSLYPVWNICNTPPAGQLKAQ